MQNHKIVTREEWLHARRLHMADEKEFTRQRDKLSQARRELPWTKLDKDYVFRTSQGNRSLGELFEHRSQLIVQHFMYGEHWDEGCPSCSFWADNYDGTIVHLNSRDISFVAVSLAPIEQLCAYKKRMSWDFNWVSSATCDFNQDFGVSFTEPELASNKPIYNFATSTFQISEAPGVSVFFKNEAGEIFHTYSAYARGLDMLNSAYHYMDLVPKGRDEAHLPHSMAWLKRHDSYHK